ncbi:MAG TPA: hypothetical protein PK286_04945 [Devosia sp.]|nr:hypothetical protein [Devosia sp.]
MISRRNVLVGMAATAAVLPAQQVLANDPQRMFFYDLYVKGTTTLSEKALARNGMPVEIVGFMAPPLKAESPFFVLTDIPMETCPFCNDIALWPDNIIYVTSDADLPMVPFDRQIRVSGKLDLGEKLDEETGFVSLVRLKSAAIIRS